MNFDQWLNEEWRPVRDALLGNDVTQEEGMVPLFRQHMTYEHIEHKLFQLALVLLGTLLTTLLGFVATR